MDPFPFEEDDLPTRRIPQKKDDGWGKKSPKEIKGCFFYMFLLFAAKVVLFWESLRANKKT